MIQGTSEWVEWRKSGIGASEVPAILGLCPYDGTPYKVWQVKTGRSKGFEGNSFTEHGKETEAKARARYELITMETMEPACATHPKYKICIASLDGARSDNKLILEIKCPTGTGTLEAAKSGKVPDHYWPQVQYQLAVTGADLLHFFVYHEKSGEDALVEVRPDLKYQGEIIAKVLEFWEKYIVTDTAPPLTDKDVKLIEDDPTIKLFCENLLARKENMSKTALDELKAEIVRMAGHPKMKCGKVQISTVLRKGVFSYHKLTISEGA
jgi:putative phage-type endonuclease